MCGIMTNSRLLPMNKYEFLSLKDVNGDYEAEIIDAVNDVIRSGWYLNGKYTRALEARLCELTQTECAVACSNGLDALRLILRAYKEMGVMRDGDEVIVQADTYIASVLAITDNGLVPVLVDADEETMNLDFAQLERCVTPRTRAVMPVHLYGTPCWHSSLTDLARKYGLKVIEDNAQAIGAESRYAGLRGTRRTGGLGDAAAFSFYPTKNIGALGDAGGVTTRDARLAATVRALANYGADRRYHNIYEGLNCRIDEIQAAALSVKLRHLNEITRARQGNASVYLERVKNPLVRLPRRFDGDCQVWHQFVVRLQNGSRDAFRAYLESEGVGTDVHYATPPHRQPCYADMSGGHFPVTDAIAAQCVSLPISEALTKDDILEISEIINGFSY